MLSLRAAVRPGVGLRNDREEGLHERARRMDVTLKADISTIKLPLKTSSDDPTVVWEDWPMVLPHNMEPCSARMYFGVFFL